MSYSDKELETFLDDIESDLAERKESWKGDAPDKGRQAVCAFANDLPDHQKAGILFVGAKDDGTPSALPITDELLLALSDMKTDGNILPLPSIIVEKRILKGVEMAVVKVQPSDTPPVRYKGRIWVRTGPRGAIATPQEERILNEKRRYRDLPFDVQPLPTCDLSALSRLLFEQTYLPNAFAADVIASNERSYEQKLASCRMIASVGDPAPTILGILTIGVTPRDWIPGAYIQFLRIEGTDLSDPIQDEALIDGDLAQVLRRIDEKMDSHNRIHVDITSEDRESRMMPYPRAALQQLIRNAVMHRVYENTNTPVRATWFDDRIEISNPGGPFGIVNRENFGRPGITDYRNPNLADAMKVLGFVQRFGIGIQTARAELKKNGNPDLEFQIEPMTVLATVRRRP
ncbi:ATP-binding protein [Desulfatitalea tepidiphila]|uniref:ATP-binding protein n=1 Tax=Desulfatitalea tepidiphila TaxID=1185843 RepID=UPI0009FB88E5|nr:ATP-binding protein [Desulfatitalea tepidiphila]